MPCFYVLDNMVLATHFPQRRLFPWFPLPKSLSCLCKRGRPVCHERCLFQQTVDVIVAVGVGRGLGLLFYLCTMLLASSFFVITCLLPSFIPEWYRGYLYYYPSRSVSDSNIELRGMDTKHYLLHPFRESFPSALFSTRRARHCKPGGCGEKFCCRVEGMLWEGVSVDSLCSKKEYYVPREDPVALEAKECLHQWKRKLFEAYAVS